MKKMLVAALILPVALLGAARPAKAGSNTAAAVLAGVAVGVGAAVILDALIPRPVVAVPPVVYAPPPPPPVVYQPAPPPVVYQPMPPPVIVHKTVIVKGPKHGGHKPYPVYVDRNPHGYWSERYIPDR